MAHSTANKPPLTILRRTLDHASTIRNACKDLIALEQKDTLTDGECQTMQRITNTLEKRVIQMVLDLGMEHHFRIPSNV